MHTSAMTRMEWFVENYVPKDKEVKVLDIGSQDVNGSYRQLFNSTLAQYTGLDMCPGKNVDYVPEDPYVWDGLEDESFDFIISGNAFEHIEYPWLTIKEMYKKLKKGGFCCVLAPFSLGEHRYPVDCYRYLGDGFRALAKWGGFKVVEVTVGGMPKETTDSKWSKEKLHYNHDDTMMVIAKVDSEDDIKDCPRFNYSKMTSRWAPT